LAKVLEFEPRAERCLSAPIVAKAAEKAREGRARQAPRGLTAKRE